MTDILVADSYGQIQPSMRLTSHEGADVMGRELGMWQPALGSAAFDTLDDWEALAARTRDLYRNDGHLIGAVQIHLDNIIGTGLRLSAKPDWRLLGQSREWAAEWSRDVEAKFTSWAYDPDNWIDASRQLNLAGILNQGYRSFMFTGDLLNVAEWLPDRPSNYATCLKTVDPDRLSNQFEQPDGDRLRGGVEFDDHGAPINYHIRRGHPCDVGFGIEAHEWDVVARELPWGRRQVLHIFEQERPDQPRGVAKFASIIRKSKMLDRYDRATLEAAVLNAVYAAVIESELDSTTVGQALGSIGDSTNPINSYLSTLSKFHSGANVRFNGVKIPHLFPNEKLHLTSPKHPIAEFGQFMEAGHRHLAAGLNLSYEQFARDYTKTNYAGARAGWLEAWQFFKARRRMVPAHHATLIYALWLEESMDRSEIETPRGAPDFWQAKAAWARSAWLGPAMGHIDPQKEENACEMRLKGGRMTYEEYFAERGQDWEEQFEQIAIEKRKREELGIVEEPPNLTKEQKEEDPA